MKNIFIIIWEGLKLFFILPLAMVSKRFFDTCWDKYYVRPLPRNVFCLCVQWLLYNGNRLGISYEDINVKIFCIIWPVITIVSIIVNIILAMIILSS